jgi:hypothetical protein
MCVSSGDEHLSHWHFNLHSLETKSMFDPNLSSTVDNVDIKQ